MSISTSPLLLNNTLHLHVTVSNTHPSLPITLSSCSLLLSTSYHPSLSASTSSSHPLLTTSHSFYPHSPNADVIRLFPLTVPHSSTEPLPNPEPVSDDEESDHMPLSSSSSDVSSSTIPLTPSASSSSSSFSTTTPTPSPPLPSHEHGPSTKDDHDSPTASSPTSSSATLPLHRPNDDSPTTLLQPLESTTYIFDLTQYSKIKSRGEGGMRMNLCHLHKSSTCVCPLIGRGVVDVKWSTDFFMSNNIISSPSSTPSTYSSSTLALPTTTLPSSSPSSNTPHRSVVSTFSQPVHWPLLPRSPLSIYVAPSHPLSPHKPLEPFSMYVYT